MGYVYGLRAADSSVYFYVGSTKHSLNKRLSEHLANVRKGRNLNRYFVNKVNKIGAQNVVIESIEVCADDVRLTRESWWIEHLIENGVKLTNVVRNGNQEQHWRTRYQYSLADNWEWALKWYADYQRGVARLGIHPEREDMAMRIQRTFAEIVERILAAPPEDRQRLIEQFE